RASACAAGCGSEEDGCGAIVASYALCGQDGLRGVERDVRFSLSGGGQGAGSGGRVPLCLALTGSAAGGRMGNRREVNGSGRGRPLYTAACDRLLRSESGAARKFWRTR